MAKPPSTTKVLYRKGKTEVKFEESIDQTQYYIHELSRRALDDVGKFIKKKFKEGYYSHFNKISGEGPKAVYSITYASKTTEHPRLEIGLPHSKRGKPVKGFYSFFQEFGTSKTPRLGLLSHAVEDNVATIIKIESQYLTGLEGEASRLDALVHEGDLEGDEDV